MQRSSGGFTLALSAPRRSELRRERNERTKPQISEGFPQGLW